MTQDTASPPPPSSMPPLPRAPVAAPMYSPLVYPPQKRRGVFWRIVFTLLLLGSIGLNFVLLVAIATGGLAGHGLVPSLLEGGSGREVVAVYTVSGIITERSAEEFYRFYQAVRDGADIKAVVLRVDTGGGGVSASDEIYKLVESIRQDLKKPVVVSMGGVAASGGYYISAPADEIYAEPTTVTGSIGVIATWPVFKGLMDKVGIEPVIIRSSHAEQWKAKENFMESPTPAVRQEMLGMLDAMQARFEKVVREGRSGKLVPPKAKPQVETAPTQPSVADPFNGKAYIAQEALDLGLVDQIGYLREAAQAAAKRAGLTSPKIMRYTVRTSLLDALMSGEAEGRSGSALRVDAETLDAATAPRILMVWKP